MATCIFTIGSVTQSMKAKRILTEYSIPVNTTKLSTSRDARGCVYGIEFNCNQKPNIYRILSGSGIPFEEHEK